MNLENKKIAFLYFEPYKQSRYKLDYKNVNDFWSSKNFGAALLRDVLERHDIKVDVCLPENAHYYDIILVSLTSHYDTYAFAQATKKNSNWCNNRKFKVYLGGFGCQNITMLTKYADYAFFGRAENEIVDMLEKGDDYQHKSFLRLNKIEKVYINQVNKFYPHEVKIDFNYNSHYKESRYGCPNRCYYCNYTFSRKNINNKNFVYNELDGASDEIEWCKSDLYNPLKPHIITAIDGYSERLRYNMNRRISDTMISDFFIDIANKTECSGVAVKLYNIVGIEGETEDDYYQFVDIMTKLDGRLSKPVTITLQNTPFNPSPVTPMSYAPILIKDYIEYKKNRIIFDGYNIKIYHSLYMDSSYTHLIACLALRYTDEYESLFNTICFDSKFKNLNTNDKYNYIINHYDIHNIVREYDVNEELPTWYLNTYISNDTIKKMRLLQKKRIKKNNYNLISKNRINELKDMTTLLNIVGGRKSSSKSIQKKEKYNYYMNNL